MQKVEYMRRWREANKERLKKERHERYLREKPFRKSRRQNKDASCALCDVFLSSAFGTKKRRKYCDDCVKREGRYIYNAWHRRAYQKKVGKEQDPMNLKGIFRTLNETFA